MPASWRGPGLHGERVWAARRASPRCTCR
jgi:hypothetical protein